MSVARHPARSVLDLQPKPRGASVAGPAVSEAPATPTVVSQGQRATLDPLGNRRMETSA
jgi:hypothetical protein